MFLYGLGGFAVGMVMGAILNRWLLRHVPRAEWRSNKDLQIKYGALNWGLAILGAYLAYIIAKHLAL